MAERRRNLNQLLAQGLSGKEIARLALQTHMEEQAGEKPTFSEADLERTRTTLRGRPGEAAIYNAWIEAARIIDFTSMEAITKSLEAEKRLIWVTNSIIGMLRQGWVRYAKRQATKILTLAEWATFPARREQARQARMAEEKIDFAEVTRNRAWWLASEELKARARALPDFDESGSGERYDYLLDLDAAAALALHETATTELAQLIKARKLRFVRNGKNVSAKLKAGKRASLAGEGVELAEEAECTLLELLEAGLPEWVEQGRAEYLTPSEFQGPVAVLQEIQPECLDEHGQFVEPGWKRIDEGLQRELRPEDLRISNRRSIFFSFLSVLFWPVEPSSRYSARRLDWICFGAPSENGKKPFVTCLPSITSWLRGAGRLSRTKMALYRPTICWIFRKISDCR